MRKLSLILFITIAAFGYAQQTLPDTVYIDSSKRLLRLHMNRNCSCFNVEDSADIKAIATDTLTSFYTLCTCCRTVEQKSSKVIDDNGINLTMEDAIADTSMHIPSSYRSSSTPPSTKRKVSTQSKSTQLYNGHIIYTGPRGGKYYIKNGKKIYIKK